MSTSKGHTQEGNLTCLLYGVVPFLCAFSIIEFGFIGMVFNNFFIVFRLRRTDISKDSFIDELYWHFRI